MESDFPLSQRQWLRKSSAFTLIHVFEEGTSFVQSIGWKLGNWAFPDVHRGHNFMSQETNNKKKSFKQASKKKKQKLFTQLAHNMLPIQTSAEIFFAVRKTRNKMLVPKVTKFARNPGFSYATVPDSTQTRYPMPLNTVKSASKKKERKRRLWSHPSLTHLKAVAAEPHISARLTNSP